jgi:hypothetical protein
MGTGVSRLFTGLPMCRPYGGYQHVVPTGLESKFVFFLPIFRPYGTWGFLVVSVSTDVSSLWGYQYFVPTGLESKI